LFSKILKGNTLVLEKLISVREAVRNPSWLLLISGIVSVTCLFISFIVFPQSVGIFTTFLITLAMTPFMVNLMSYEEVKEEEMIEKKKNLNIFQRNREILLVYTALFCGIVISLVIIFLVLPETVAEKLFNEQMDEIARIRGSVIFVDTVQKIFANNIGVLFLAFLFSFLFGSGAIFVLAWNASILSTAIGLTAKSLGGLRAVPLAVLTYFPHGSLEILAYFMAGVAGGAISVAITRRHGKCFKLVLMDMLLLLGFAIGLLFVAGIIESLSVYVG